MTIDDVLAYGRFQLNQSSTSHLDARILLEHLLKKEHSYFIAHGDELLNPEQLAAYKVLVARAREGEPIPYITGEAPFFDFMVRVNTAVLIPRPETEELVAQVVQVSRSLPPQRIVDIGTGSGCIAIALARQLPSAQIEAVDISPEALHTARTNAAQLAPGRISFYQGDLLQPIPAERDIVVANLPYISESEWTMLDDGVKLHEPSLALKGGHDGLDLVRRLLQEAAAKLSPNGAIFLEIGWQQGDVVLREARSFFPDADVQLRKDLAGRDRIVTVKRYV